MWAPTEGFRPIGVMFLNKKHPRLVRPKGDGGRWGVAQGCDCRSILDAIAMLIEAQRPGLAMHLIEQELNSQA